MKEYYEQTNAEHYNYQEYFKSHSKALENISCVEASKNRKALFLKKAEDSFLNKNCKPRRLFRNRKRALSSLIKLQLKKSLFLPKQSSKS
jgi:hypothetical protein